MEVDDGPPLELRDLDERQPAPPAQLGRGQADPTSQDPAKCDGEAAPQLRRRFIIDRWVWELPGGYVDQPGDDPLTTAAQEVEEETGWRARGLELLTTFQPLVGSVAQENLLFIGRNGADYIGAPADINEAERIRWIPLAGARSMMDRGEIVGAGSIIGLLRVLSERSGGQPAS